MQLDRHVFSTNVLCNIVHVTCEHVDQGQVSGELPPLSTDRAAFLLPLGFSARCRFALLHSRVESGMGEESSLV